MKVPEADTRNSLPVTYHQRSILLRVADSASTTSRREGIKAVFFGSTSLIFKHQISDLTKRSVLRTKRVSSIEAGIN